MSNLPEDMRERALATLRTRCHRPNCKIKHRAKTEDTINAIVALLEEVEQRSIDTLAKAQLNMRPLIALKNGNGDIDNKWYVMYWDDKDQVWNRARYVDIVREVGRKAREDELFNLQQVEFDPNRTPSQLLMFIQTRMRELQSPTKESKSDE